MGGGIELALERLERHLPSVVQKAQQIEGRSLSHLVWRVGLLPDLLLVGRLCSRVVSVRPQAWGANHPTPHLLYDPYHPSLERDQLETVAQQAW
jgi:hypothetical protein